MLYFIETRFTSVFNSSLFKAIMGKVIPVSIINFRKKNVDKTKINNVDIIEKRLVKL